MRILDQSLIYGLWKVTGRHIVYASSHLLANEERTRFVRGKLQRNLDLLWWYNMKYIKTCTRKRQIYHYIFPNRFHNLDKVTKCLDTFHSTITDAKSRVRVCFVCRWSRVRYYYMSDEHIGHRMTNNFLFS